MKKNIFILCMLMSLATTIVFTEQKPQWECVAVPSLHILSDFTGYMSMYEGLSVM